MKSMDDSSNINNNWLGFSLSPHMNMEAAASANPQQHEHHHHDDHHQYTEHHSHAESSNTTLPTCFYTSSSSTSPHYFNNHGICYGVVTENEGFHSPLTVMPLKSDGSLCIMEALSRSQPVCEGMAPSSAPKLEDFLGGASRETMSLSLDSIYYQNTPPETNNGEQEDQVAQMHYYSGFSCHGVYQPPLERDAKVTQLGNHCDSQIPQMGHHDDDPILSLNNQMMLGLVEGGGGAGCGGSSGSGGLMAPMSSGRELQSLTLSMSPGSQSSCVTAQRQISPGNGNESLTMEGSKKRVAAKAGQKQTVHRKSIETFGQRTSQYRGVTRHRWTGRYEAHLWDNSCKKEGQTRKGRQVYLGGYDMEEKAARAYDLAALKYWGPSTHINFPLENYRDEMEEMKNMTRQEYVAHLRRKSSGFSRGASMYRGVTRHHQHGRWQARIGRVAGNKDLYLGTFSTQEEAAEAYDIAAIKFRGVNAVTNFDITRYNVEKIMASNTLLAGELARRNKEAEGSHLNNNIPSAHNKVENLVLQADQNDGASGNYQNAPAFSMALQNLVGIDPVMNDSGKVGAHFSNPSSLVTSLGSSREGSPDKNGSNMIFDKNSMASKSIHPVAGVTSWFPSAQLRSSDAISMAHLPVFAAWNDT